MKREVIFFVEFVSLIILIIGYKLLVYVLKINNLALMNFPYFIFTGIFIVLSFLILIQIVIIIYTSVKSKILKGTIIITSIIGSIIFFLYSLLILAFMYNPEQPVFEEQPESNIEIAYGIEDVPKPWWKAVLFALQITLVDFTPFMWAAGFASLAGIDQPDFVPTLLCACFFCMGICTFLQTTVGNRLPIVQGSSSALMSSMGNIAAVYGLPAVWGASLIGGLIQTILGITKTVSKVRAFLPPVVVGSVVTAIGFVAARIAVQWTFSRQEPLYLVLALISFLLALILKFKTKGMVSQGFILITVGIFTP